MGRFTRGTLAGSGALGHLGRSLAFASGGFLAAAGLISVMKDAVKGAASLETQVGRTTKEFGTQAAGILAWSKTSAEALHMARAAALATANDFGTLFTNLGIAPGKAAEMSKTLTQLAADISAVTGKDSSTTTSALTSALEGRTLGLKQLGVAIDANMVKTEAERMGLVKSTVDLGKVAVANEQVRIAEYNVGQAVAKHGAQSVEAASATNALAKAQASAKTASAGHAETLTLEQKALATYNLVLAQTQKMHNGVANSSHTLAGETALLHAQIGDLQEQLGTALIPVLTHYLPLLSAWIDRNEKNHTFQRDFNAAVKTGGEIVSGVVGIVKTAAKVWGDLADAVGGNKKAVELLAALFVGSKLIGAFASLRGNLGQIGLAAGEKGAAGKVGLLSSRLSGLGALSIAPIVIPIALAISSGEKSWIQKHLGKAGAALFDGVMTVAGGGIIGGPGAVYADLTGGGGGGKGGASAQGIVKTGKALGPSSGAIYARGGTGGTSGGHVVFDCSGYVYDVFTKNGFNGFPRTSEAQFNTVRGPNWTSEPIALAAVQPGDVVFFNEGHDPPPGHVALIVAGSGLAASYIEYYQTGKPARTSQGFAGRNVSAAKRFYLVKNTSGHSNDPASDAGGGNQTPTPKPAKDSTGGSNGTTTGVPFTEKSKPPKPKILSGSALLDHGLQLALATAHGTPGTADDLKYLKDARAELEKLQKTASKAEQVPIAKELANVNRQITAIDTKNLKSKLAEMAKAYKQHAAEVKGQLAAITAAWTAHVQKLQDAADAAKTTFEAGWSQLANAADAAFSTATQTRLTAMGRATSAQLALMGKATSTQLTQMQKDAAAAIAALQVTVSGPGFASFAFGLGGQTPTEAKMAAEDAARQASGDAQSIVDAQAQIDAAKKAIQDATQKVTGNASTGQTTWTPGLDPTVTPEQAAVNMKQLQDTLVQAQKSLDSALFQQQRDADTTKAAAERAAADKALADAQTAAQGQADQQQQAVQDQADVVAQAYQDQQDAAAQAYTDQRALLQQALDDQVAAIQAAFEAGKITASAAFAELTALYSQNGIDIASLSVEIGGNIYAGVAAWTTPIMKLLTDVAAAVAAVNAAINNNPITGGTTGIGASDTGAALQALHEAVVAGTITQATYDYIISGHKLQIPGMASGGWAGTAPPAIDPRDTIPSLLRKGEYVMTPEEIEAGGPTWLRGRGAGGGSTYELHFHGPMFETLREIENAVAQLARPGLNRLGPTMNMGR